MTLSVCLITKNEEAHLRRCLESVRGLWDDLVIADTGSTDATVEIARDFGARIFHVAWQDDFSAARNFCISHATGDWILSLDADESIAVRDHAAIRSFVSRDDVDAVLAAQRHYLTSTVIGWQAGSGGYDEGAPYPGFLDVECRRLFRNRPWLRFHKRVHEEVLSADPAQPLRQVHGQWVIHHFGKVSDEAVLRAKAEAYIRIGAKKIEEQPDDPQAHYEQGLAYGELGRSDEALPYFERALALSPGFRDAQVQVGVCHARMGRHRQALTALGRAARALPQHAAVIALEQGNVHDALGDTPAAERAFRRALAASPAFAAASVNLARLYERRGRHEQAQDCVEAGLRYSANHRDLLALRVGFGRASIRLLLQQRRFDEARARLAEMDADADAELAGFRGAVALGLGNAPEAATHLRRSLELQGSHEAALNLSIALLAVGDEPGALAAAAEAVRLAPNDATALARFRQLAGQTLRQRPPGAGETSLTLFFWQPHSIAFDGRTPRTRGLGGTESAIVYLAEALAGRGHRVVVFNNCDEPGRHEGVEYGRWETLPARAVAERPDVVVGVRDWQRIGRARLAPVQVFWTGDAFDQPVLEGLGEAAGRPEIDFFMLQSEWHAATFRAHHGVPDWATVRTRLGAAASSAARPSRPAAAARGRRLAYASTPFRGLDVLLDLFPRIRAACPDAELDVFSSMQVYGVAREQDQDQFGAIYKKANQPGVHLVGSLPQLELAQRLQQTRVLAYPNHYAETFCIAALEAQAAGCAVVTSQLGALPETVGDGGVCIPGDPRSEAYQDAFVDACVRMLSDDEVWQATSERALARAWGGYTWAGIAAEWETFCRAALTVEPPVLERVAVHLEAGR
ncbi:MAG TPA: glycosyltransferase, partial [Vicinamibacterales bacterium]